MNYPSKYSFLFIALTVGVVTHAQTKTDSVIINVGEKSRVIFAIGDKADLQTLKQYDFQAVVNDLVAKLEKQDSSHLEKPADSYLKTTEQPVANTEPQREEDWDRSWDDRRRERDRERQDDNLVSVTKTRRYYGRRTYHSFNFDIGTNNFVTPNNSFPNQNNELYSVRPWGSWYVGINSTERTRLARKFFLEWGVGVSWYNFKFENDQIRISKDPSGVIFSQDTRDVDFVKSKLTATYLNASMVPLLDFGGRNRHALLFDNDRGSSFRIGVGPYAGYRIDSYSKLVFKENGDKHRERDHDSYYLNNVRYGLRLQLGFGGTDIFVNYDMNELFATGKGPKLNAFSFGITL